MRVKWIALRISELLQYETPALPSGTKIQLLYNNLQVTCLVHEVKYSTCGPKGDFNSIITVIAHNSLQYNIMPVGQLT